LALVPDDAAFVGHVDVAALTRTPLWAANVDAWGEDPDTKRSLEVLRGCGLRPAELASLTFAGTEGRTALVLVGAGLGDLEALACVVRGLELDVGGDPRREVHAGRPALVLGDGGRIAHVVDARTLVVVDPSWDPALHEVVGAGREAPAGLREALEFARVDAPIWLAARLPADAERELAGSPAQGLRHVGAAIEVGEGLAIEAWAGTPDAAQAAQLRDFAASTMGQYRSMAAAFGIPRELLERVRLGVRGDQATATLAVGADDLARIRANLQRMGGGGP
jgi:hypothetical protein